MVGAFVELAVTQALALEDNSDGIRRALDLGLDDGVQRLLHGVVMAGAVEVRQHVLVLDRWQDPELAQWPLRQQGEGLGQVHPLLQQPGDAGRREARALVAGVNLQSLALMDQQGQRIAGALLVDQPVEGQAVRGLLLQSLGYRVVLEHQQGIEQGHAIAAGPALYIRQARVLLLAQGQVQGLDLAQPVAASLPRVRAADHR
ncbi:hypothetical protein D3C81_1351040 [compost metagenome]